MTVLPVSQPTTTQSSTSAASNTATAVEKRVSDAIRNNGLHRMMEIIGEFLSADSRGVEGMQKYLPGQVTRVFPDIKAIAFEDCVTGITSDNFRLRLNPEGFKQQVMNRWGTVITNPPLARRILNGEQLGLCIRYQYPDLQQVAFLGTFDPESFRSALGAHPSLCYVTPPADASWDNDVIPLAKQFQMIDLTNFAIDDLKLYNFVKYVANVPTLRPSTVEFKLARGFTAWHQLTSVSLASMVLGLDLRLTDATPNDLGYIAKLTKLASLKFPVAFARMFNASMIQFLPVTLQHIDLNGAHITPEILNKLKARCPALNTVRVKDKKAAFFDSNSAYEIREV